MRIRIGLLALIVSLVSPLLAAPLPKLVLVTDSKGFVHDVVKHPDGGPSVVQKTFAAIADQSKLFELETTDDASILTPDKLKQTQIVVFYTTGNLQIDVKAFDQWIKDGGGFLATHTGTDTLHGNADYLKIIGGEFNGHPWTARTKVTLKLNDPANPTVSMFDPHYTLNEEIYHYKNFEPASVRVLMSLDMERTELKKPEHVPVVWCREYGKGKVFHTALGHNKAVWESEVYPRHLTAAIEWLLGKVTADATPNPEVGKQEEELAKKAIAATQPATTRASASQSSVPASTPQLASVVQPENPPGNSSIASPTIPAAGSENNLSPASPASASTSVTKTPTVVEGFSISPFVQAPEIKSPAGIAVTADGKVFVGEDAYNTGPDRKMGLSDIKLCVDTDHDGRADRITTFANQINSPQGMCVAGGTLYVTHAPFLTALRDTDGDGVADVRDDLVTGLGPVPEGLVHHIPSGVHIGIDGWLYVSIGDKGIKEATGKDGRKITLHGGGIVRVRPDGTELEVFCTGTRNIYDVALDPYLNAFTRDNTNDGDGWWSRLTQMQRDASFGYPNLYKNFGDEMLQPMADYGSGGATGSIYIHEANLPGNFGDCLYTTDWAKGMIYRHVLTPDGASFFPTQEKFVTDIYSTHTDVDASGRIYCSDWGRKDWGTSRGVGAVYVIQPIPKNTGDGSAGINRSAGSVSNDLPDCRGLSTNDLVTELANRSAVHRREAQMEALRRGNSEEMDQVLKQAIQNKEAPLYGRVAQLFTLTQLMGAESRTVISNCIADADLREFVLRALVDRSAQLRDVKAQLFVDALGDSNPRVRVQAAIGLGRLRDPSVNAKLVPLTADNDWNVRHAAQQALRLLGGSDACLAAIASTSDPKLIASALCVLRTEHDRRTIIGLEQLLARDSRPVVRRECIQTLARLYEVEATWDGTWWGTRPDPRGPNFKSARWEESPAVAAMLVKLASDSDSQIAKDAIAAIGLCGVSEAAPVLAKLVADENPLRLDAAHALIAMKAPESIPTLEKLALSSTFQPDLRARAAQAIGAMEGDAAQAAVIRLIVALDATSDQAASPLEKLTDALASRVATAEQAGNLIKLVTSAAYRPTRIAAAESLLRSTDSAVKDRIASLWDSADEPSLDAMLTAAAHVPSENVLAYQSTFEKLLQARQDSLRQGAMIALGHLNNPETVKILLALAKKPIDEIAASTALAEFSADAVADDQVLPIAQLLAGSVSSLSRRTDRAVYSGVLAAAEKFTADPRIGKSDAEKLLALLKRNGVIYSYLRTDPIRAESAGQSFTFVCPPEQSPAGPFGTFTVGDSTYGWKPLNVTDPQGIATLDMPDNSVMYLTASIDSPAACTGVLTCGSNDGIQAWLNGAKVMTQDKTRSVKADENRARVQLLAGTNTLLLKLNNQSGQAAIQARLRWRPTDFEPAPLADYIGSMPANADRGRALFTSLSCVKCHTTDAHEEQKGPYLGDVASKYDAKYLIESIIRPSAKIAQGFATARIIAADVDRKGTTESIGFVTRETGDEVQMRDLTGKVMTVNKFRISKRDLLAGSMMPEGLTDALSLEDFRSLLGYLQSLKGEN